MKIIFKDKWLSTTEKKKIKNALVREKEDMDSVTLYIKVDHVNIMAEWIEGNKYKASVIF